MCSSALATLPSPYSTSETRVGRCLCCPVTGCIEDMTQYNWVWLYMSSSIGDILRNRILSVCNRFSPQVGSLPLSGRTGWRGTDRELDRELGKQFSVPIVVQALRVPMLPISILLLSSCSYMTRTMHIHTTHCIWWRNSSHDRCYSHALILTLCSKRFGWVPSTTAWQPIEAIGTRWHRYYCC